ncbi:hypothetical protein D3C71_1907760 [compost metagenome]
MEEPAAAIPPIPAAAAMLSCRTEPNRLSMIPAALGAVTMRLYCRPGPDDHAANAHSISRGTVMKTDPEIVESNRSAST